MAEIRNLDEYLLMLMDGLPPQPKRYQLHCHPDVFLAIRAAGDRNEYSPPGNFAVGTPALYGSADILVRPELGSGGWELHENGQMLKSGRLGCVTVPVTHVIYCRGCRRAWIEDVEDPDACACECTDVSDPLYEDWVTDPDPASIPPEAWKDAKGDR